jgi:hypothetical protein
MKLPAVTRHTAEKLRHVIHRLRVQAGNTLLFAFNCSAGRFWEQFPEAMKAPFGATANSHPGWREVI